MILFSAKPCADWGEKKKKANNNKTINRIRKVKRNKILISN